MLSRGRDEWWEARVPPSAARELRRFLECGILAHGVARARGDARGHDVLIAFSCNGRAVCPSCNTRRMAETAAPLAVRDSLGASTQARTGAEAFIHRFGSALNEHTHFHVVMIDGVFEPDPEQGVRFIAAQAIDADAVRVVQTPVRRRILRAFVRRGRIDTQTRKEMDAWDHGGGFSLDAPNSPRRPAVTALAPEAVTPVPASHRAVKTAAEDLPETIRRTPARYLWVMLLARIYEAFPLTCPQCGAEMRIIAFITEAVDVRAILEHIGEPATPPRIAQARGPPAWYEDAMEHAIAAEAGSAGDPDAQPAPEYEHDQRVSWSSRPAGLLATPLPAFHTHTHRRTEKPSRRPLAGRFRPHRLPPLLRRGSRCDLTGPRAEGILR